MSRQTKTTQNTQTTVPLTGHVKTPTVMRSNETISFATQFTSTSYFRLSLPAILNRGLSARVNCSFVDSPVHASSAPFYGMIKMINQPTACVALFLPAHNTKNNSLIFRRPFILPTCLESCISPRNYFPEWISLRLNFRLQFLVPHLLGHPTFLQQFISNAGIFC